MSNSDDAIAVTLNGPWIGETMGCDSPAHLWEITITTFGEGFRYARIATRWEGEAKQSHFHPDVVVKRGKALLEFHTGVRSVWVGAQHFVIPEWDTNNIRGNVGPTYDVVFSRPGVPELSAKDVYQRYIAMKKMKKTKVAVPRKRKKVKQL